VQPHRSRQFQESSSPHRNSSDPPQRTDAVTRDMRLRFRRDWRGSPTARASHRQRPPGAWPNHQRKGRRASPPTITPQTPARSTTVESRFVLQMRPKASRRRPQARHPRALWVCCQVGAARRENRPMRTLPPDTRHSRYIITSTDRSRPDPSKTSMRSV
jgi:hypothetical protein